MAKKQRQQSEIISEYDGLVLEIKELKALVLSKNKQIAELNDELDRLQITEAIGVSNGVRLRNRNWANNRKLDSALGTVLRVNRTRAVVDFGSEFGEWTIPVDQLLSVASGREQGVYICL